MPVLAALTCVGPGVYPVHRDRQRLVRFPADGAEGYRACSEPPDDIRGRLYFVQRKRLIGGLEFEEASNRAHLLSVVVGPLSELQVGRPVIRSRGMLELRDRGGIPHVILAIASPLVEPTRVELHTSRHNEIYVSERVPDPGLLFNLVDADAANA